MKETGQRINFTKRSLEAIAPSEKRSITYDSQIRSLGISVTPKGTKTFLVYRKINGTPRKITVGKFPDMTVEQARRKAQRILSQIADGKDPSSELILARQRSITLQEVLDDYLTVRKDLKPITLRDYRLLLKEYFSDWQSKPIVQITKDMVLQRHREIGERSKARANYAMRLLRALFNFSSAQYEASDGTKLYPDNPTKRLSETRSWYKVERRKTFIKPHELPKWFQAVNDLKQTRSDELTFAIKHYLLLLLFTGLRREELAQLKWENVDLQDRSFTLKSHTTKNREEHVVPMSCYVASIFETLHEAREGPYVFPGKDSKAYLKSPRKHMLRVTKESGVSFNLHDLRRTFITIAESLDISIFTIKRLINHKISQDVTGSYIISYTDRLRKATQMVTDHILSILKQEVLSVTTEIESKILPSTHKVEVVL